MKKIFNLFLIFIFQVSFGQEIEKITVPERVVYNYADNEIIDKTKKLISDNLVENYKNTIVEDLLIIGPILWERFKENKEIQKIEGSRVVIHIDENEVDGKASQNKKDSEIIWNEFKKIITDEYTLRKATEFELDYYWTVISYDIDEPLLILETTEHKYILDFNKETLKLLWLDEVPIIRNNSYYNPIEDKNYVSQNGFKTYQNGEEVDSIDEGLKETKLETVVLLSPEDDFEKYSSLDDITEIVDKTNKIFEQLFKDSKKSGKLMVQFELKPKKNEIQFAVRDDLDLEIMKEFEKQINQEKYPNSRKKPVKLQLIYKVNSFNDQ